MAPRKNSFIPDMKETRWRTETFANPYAPIAPKQTAFRTPKMSATAMPKSEGFDLGGFLKWGFGGPISKEQQAINQAKEDSETVTMFGRTVKTADLVNLAASAALAGAGIYAARSGMQVRASNRSLAAARIRQAEEIQANRTAARIQGRDFADQRQAARRARQSTLLRASRLERIEAALRDRDPGAAQAFGDRAYALRAGKTIRSEMRGAKGHDFTDSPFAGSHHSYTPMDQSVPASHIGLEWMRSSGRSMTDLGRLYSSGVPRGGYIRQPNLRRRTPINSQWTPDLKNEVIDPSAVDDFTRSRIAPLLDDATSFRNRSASFMQGNRNPEGRYIFPRIYTNTRSYPQGAYDPAEYQLRAFYNYTSMMRRGTATTLPRSTRYVRPGQRRIGGGK